MVCRSGGAILEQIMKEDTWERVKAGGDAYRNNANTWSKVTVRTTHCAVIYIYKNLLKYTHLFSYFFNMNAFSSYTILILFSKITISYSLLTYLYKKINV